MSASLLKCMINCEEFLRLVVSEFETGEQLHEHTFVKNSK